MKPCTVRNPWKKTLKHAHKAYHTGTIMDFATPRISKSVEGSYKQNQEKKPSATWMVQSTSTLAYHLQVHPGVLSNGKTILTACYFQSYFTNLDCFLKEDPPVPNYLLRVRSCEVVFFYQISSPIFGQVMTEARKMSIWVLLFGTLVFGLKEGKTTENRTNKNPASFENIKKLWNREETSIPASATPDWLTVYLAQQRCAKFFGWPGHHYFISVSYGAMSTSSDMVLILILCVCVCVSKFPRPFRFEIITSWWFQPLWNILVKLDHFPR